ncbi:MAG: nucleotidyl transferase AbiEii/AbiGii toxin family protein, partial [Bacteroidales bacterium]|nr:nucleotidyl transferase AbiEii/AbiGii toxin family protein [Bacteroidales bacterium]
MHREILTQKQNELLPYLQVFKRKFYLVGGTAVALHIGHRRSIDFDLFCLTRLNKKDIRQKLTRFPIKIVKLSEDTDQIHFLINDVKVTFLNYPYKIEHSLTLEQYLTLPSLLSLASMKAYALGRRGKWKDYVDLYFILKEHLTINEISM